MKADSAKVLNIQLRPKKKRVHLRLPVSFTCSLLANHIPENGLTLPERSKCNLFHSRNSADTSLGTPQYHQPGAAFSLHGFNELLEIRIHVDLTSHMLL